MDTPEQNPSDPQLQIGPARLLRWRALLTMYAGGLAVVVPVLGLIAAVSLSGLSWVSFLVPLAVVAAAVWCRPLGLFENAYLAKRLRHLEPAASQPGDHFFVQLTLTPRLHQGFRAVLEDADDFGWLSVSDGAVSFRGDAIEFVLPRGNIRGVELRGAGIRSLLVHGAHTSVEVRGWEKVSELEFAERSCWTLRASRRIARKLYEALAAGAGN